MPDTKTLTFKTRRGRSFVIRELNGFESLNGFRAAGSAMAIGTFVAALAIVSIDGDVIGPMPNDVELKAFMATIGDGEMSATMKQYGTFSDEEPSVTDVGEAIQVKYKSGKTFTLREMNSLESMNAYKQAESPLALGHFVVAYALESIDDHKVQTPTTAKEAQLSLQRLTDGEVRRLSEAYNRFSMTDADLGNVSAPGDYTLSLLPLPLA